MSTAFALVRPMLISKSALFLAILTVVSLVSTTSFASSKCEDLFAISTESQIQAFQQEDQQASQLNDFLSDQLLARSQKLETQFRKQAPFYPVVVVGAGLHTSIFSTQAAHIGKSSAVLAIETGSRVSKVFGDLAGSFKINSSERENRSSNIFPGAPLQMKDLTTQMFPNSVHIGLLGSVAQRASQVPVLFNNTVLSIQDLKSAGEKAPGRYLITTSQGLKIYADKVVLSTGLGTPSTKVLDPSFQSVLNKYTDEHRKNPRKILPVMMVDSFLRTIALNEFGPKVSALKEIKNKSIAVIGAGDGARIAVEAIIKEMHPSVRVLWMGQKAETPEQYKATTWERYYGIAPEMGKRIQGGFVGHVSAGRVLESGKIELTYGEGKQVQADYVINATGYDSVIPQLVSKLSKAVENPELSFESVQEKIPELTSPTTVIGKRLEVADLAGQEIYIIGPAGGPFATPKELLMTATENPVSIEVLGPRTRTMADYLLEDVAVTDKRIYALRSDSANQKVIKLQPTNSTLGLNLTKESLLNLAKVELTAALRSLKFHRDQVNLQVIKAPNDEIMLSVFEVTNSGAQVVAERLQSNPQLLAILKELLQNQKAVSFHLHF